MVTFITKYNNLQQNCGLCTLIRDLKIQRAGTVAKRRLIKVNSRPFNLLHDYSNSLTLQNVRELSWI